MEFKIGEYIIHKDDRQIYQIRSLSQGKFNYYLLKDMKNKLLHVETDSKNFLKLGNSKVASILYWPSSQL